MKKEVNNGGNSVLFLLGALILGIGLIAVVYMYSPT